MIKRRKKSPTSLYNSSCSECDLCNMSENVCIPGRGNTSARVMVVGDVPNYTEVIASDAVSSKSAQLAINEMRKLEVDTSEFFYTHAVKCRTAEGATVSAKQIKACKEYLAKEIAFVKPEVVLLMGSNALKAGYGKGKIMDLHGNPVEKDGVTYFPILSPGMAIRDPRRRGEFQRDIKRFVDFLNGERKAIHKMNLTIVDSFDKMAELIQCLYMSDEFAYDCETTGLNRYANDAEVTMMSFSTKDRDWVVPFHKGPFTYLSTHESQRLFLKTIQSLFKDRLTVAANGKFDDLYLLEQYGVWLKEGFDVMLAAHLVDENSPQGLKPLATRYLDAHPWDIDLNTKKGGVRTREEYQKLYEYAGWDSYFTLRLRPILQGIMEEDVSLWKLFKELVTPLVHAYERVESNGVYLNMEKLQQVEDKYTEQRETAISRMNSIYYRSYKEIHGEDSPREDINWGSSKQIKEILFDELDLVPAGKTPKGEPSTAEDYINRMKGQHEILEPLLDFRHAEKIISSFVTGWRKRLVKDRYLHPRFKINGTVTGRPSSSDPNFQQVPRLKEIRSIISAPPGWVAFELDYSQLELRVVANISGDPEMVRIFQTGGDIHTATASAVSGQDVENMEAAQKKVWRKNAKPVNFGFVYGMGAKKFKDYSLDKYGVEITEKESMTFRKRYFQKYAGLTPWHNRQKKIVHSLGQVRTFTGRIRHLPFVNSPDKGLVAEAERNAINAPVQGFGAEMLLMALVDLDKTLNHDEVKIYGTVHDALIGRVRVDKMHWIGHIRKTMENPTLLDTFGIDLSVPITTDITIGDWGDGMDPVEPTEDQMTKMNKKGWSYDPDGKLFKSKENVWGFFEEQGSFYKIKHSKRVRAVI